jgi:hypothetical protein
MNSKSRIRGKRGISQDIARDWWIGGDGWIIGLKEVSGFDRDGYVDEHGEAGG